MKLEELALSLAEYGFRAVSDSFAITRHEARLTELQCTLQNTTLHDTVRREAGIEYAQRIQELTMLIDGQYPAHTYRTWLEDHLAKTKPRTTRQNVTG